MLKQRGKKGQGTTEYIVILGIIVAIAVGILLPKIRPALDSKVANIVSSINS